MTNSSIPYRQGLRLPGAGQHGLHLRRRRGVLQGGARDGVLELDLAPLHLGLHRVLVRS